MPLFFLFIVVPLCEFLLLFRVADWIGFLPTVLLVIATALVGVNLLKRQGLQTVVKMQDKLGNGQVPAQEMIEGLLLFFAGGLLLTPGLITDVLGFLILLPPTRQLMAARITPWLMKRVNVVQPKDFRGFNGFGSGDGTNPFDGFTPPHSQQRPRQNDSDIIEGEYTDVSEQQKIGRQKDGQ